MEVHSICYIEQSLKKVNTSKMPKLTSFFRKKTD